MKAAAAQTATCTTCRAAPPAKGHLCSSCYAILIEVAAVVGFPADDLTARRFLQRVNANGADPGTDEVFGPCWEWTGAQNGDGYGMFRVAGRLVGAHVYAYSLIYGDPGFGEPDDDTDPRYRLVVDHQCHTRACSLTKDCPHRACVNPEHLRARSQSENLRRGNTEIAARAAQTHCHAAHPLSGDNLYRHPQRGTRHCRTCQRVASARSERLRTAAKRAQRDLMTGQTSLDLPGLQDLTLDLTGAGSR